MSRESITDVKSQLDTHEAVCAERWRETINRIKRIEAVMMGSAGTIIVLLLTMILRDLR
jgi:predicted nucleic acid-binding Zn ribbon protein